jgi:crotonobetainyl-CoA:carnitine CoA-transferase CaiB-like acyl-CoA transferase
MNANPDGLSALGAAMAMLVGLVGRERHGKAPILLTTMLTTSIYAVCNHIVGDPSTVTPDPDLRGLSARYRLYEASDGWIFLAAPKESEWDGLVAALTSYVDLGADARFADEALRRQNDGVLAETLVKVFDTRSAADWERDLVAADIGCVEVSATAPEARLMSEEFGGASGYITTAAHPTFDEHPRLTPAVRFSRSAGSSRGGILNGQHTDAILGELGYDRAAIADLRERNIVK